MEFVRLSSPAYFPIRPSLAHIERTRHGGGWHVARLMLSRPLRSTLAKPGTRLDLALVYTILKLAAKLVPPRMWPRIERYARLRRIETSVPADVIAQVKAQKAKSGDLRNTYEHNPRFGVIVTSFNQLWNVRSLAQQLRENQDVSEIVVCEDGSIDGSLEAWVSCLDGPNHFIVRSNDLHDIRPLDRAFRLCRSDILCIVQDDDVIPDDLAWAMEALDLFDSTRLGVLGGFIAYQQPPANSPEGGEPDLSFLKSTIRKGDDFRFVPTVSIGPYYVRSSCYKECGGFDTNFSAPGQAGVGFDEEFGLRVWLRGWQVGYLHQPFKTGVKGVYDFGAGGTFLFGEASERTTHDRKNKRRIASMYGKYHDEIVEAVRQSNARRMIST